MNELPAVVRAEHRGAPVLAVCLALLVSGCWFGTMYRPEYRFAISAVDVQGPAEVSSTGAARPGKPTSYDGEWLGWDWAVETRKLMLSIQNRTDTAVLVRWDLATFTSIDGVSDRLIDLDVRFKDRLGHKPVTTLEPGSTRKESVYPAGFLFWEQEKVVDWKSTALVPQLPGIATSEPEKAEAFARQQIGKTLQVTVPVKRGGETRSYTFVLVIDGYAIKRIVGT